MIQSRFCQLFSIAFLFVAPFCVEAAKFEVGFAKRDVTPPKATPMWGYGARHDMLSQGTIDPLFAKAVVIDVGDEKLAIVGLDLGRSPTEPVMQAIREAVKEKAGVGHVLISGSHTHHGPVIELLNEPEKGQGKFDDAVSYVDELKTNLIEAIVEAAGATKPARIGWGVKEVDLNRNRHTKIEPKPRDTELAVIRFEDLEGKPLVHIVNFAAHPVMTDGKDLRFSADYPGYMMNHVEKETGVPCVFMQGASGDMSAKSPEGVKGPEQFGEVLGREVLAVAQTIETATVEEPSIQGAENTFDFKSRIDLRNPIIVTLLSKAFFPELANSFADELPDGRLRPQLTTILLNGELALVGGSGEFFSNLANRLKERSRTKETLFFGYCNGHHMYFPTIEAAAEGGYGADQTVSWVELGAGERMMDQALINLYTMMGKFSDIPMMAD